MPNKEVFQNGGISHLIDKIKQWCSSMFDGKHDSATAVLSSSGWLNDTQTVNVQGVTSTCDVIVGAVPADCEAYALAGIVCTAQGAGTLTFTKANPVQSNLTVNVIILADSSSSSNNQV